MTGKKSISVGDIFTNKDGCVAKVISWVSWENITIQFQDSYGFIKVVRSDSIRNGAFRNPYRKSCLGVGYIGDGKYSTRSGGSKSTIYIHWLGAMTRSYSNRYKSLKPTYQDCTVCEEWHDFQNFAGWVEKQTGFDKGYHLDKDLIVKGNKIYSPETCVLLPSDINMILTSSKAKRGDSPIGVSFHKAKGKYCSSIRIENKLKHLGTFNTPEEAFYAYKEAKENYIKEVANKYKDQIDIRAYEALMKYEVNIDD